MNNIKKHILNPWLFAIILGLALAWSWFHHLDSVKALRYDVPSGNLLTNGSFEEYSNNGNPVGWEITSTQALTTPSYEPGYVGNRSFRLDINNYQTGEVHIDSSRFKLEPNQNYFFKAYYLNSVDVELLVHYFYKDGTDKLVRIDQYPAVDPIWSTMSTVIRVDDTVKEVGISIVSAANGYIKLDGAYVVKRDGLTTPEQPKTDPNALPNADLQKSKQADHPDQWLSYRIGENQAAFKYISNGDNKYIRTEVSGYRGGEAKWQYLPLAVRSQEPFHFSVDYRSDATVDLVAEYDLSDGTKQFSQLATLMPSNRWTTFSIDFETVPKAKNLFISLVMHNNGFVESDNYQLTSQSAQIEVFDKPRISITFDDGWETQYTEALPLLEAYKIPATFYINSTSVGQPDFMDLAQLKNLKDRGYQVGSHSDKHDDITAISPRLMQTELKDNNEFLTKKLGIEVIDFATPYGKHDSQTDYYIARLQASNRGTESGINTRHNFNVYNLKALYVNHDTDPKLIQDYIDQTKATNGWLILVYHRISTGNSNLELPIDLFKQHLEVIQKSGLSPLSVRQAVEEIQPQL